MIPALLTLFALAQAADGFTFLLHRNQEVNPVVIAFYQAGGDPAVLLMKLGLVLGVTLFVVAASRWSGWTWPVAAILVLGALTGAVGAASNL